MAIPERSFWWGNPAYNQQVSTLNPQQTDLVNQSGAFGLNQLRNPTQGFQPIEDNARRQFQTRTLPTIAERFSQNLQGDSRLGSSGFADILSQAGTGLDSELAALRAQYGLQSQGNALKALQLGQTPTFENQLVQGDPGALRGIAEAFSSALPHALAGLATGGGSLFGSGISALMNFLNRQGGDGQGGGIPQAQQQQARNNFSGFRQMPYNQQLASTQSYRNPDLTPITDAWRNPGSLNPALQGKPGLPSQLSVQGLFNQFGRQPSNPAVQYPGFGQFLSNSTGIQGNNFDWLRNLGAPGR